MSKNVQNRKKRNPNFKKILDDIVSSHFVTQSLQYYFFQI